MRKLKAPSVTHLTFYAAGLTVSGLSSPNIQRLETQGRILIELPGVKEPERVRKLLQGTASLEFWETYESSEIFPFFQEAIYEAEGDS